MTSNDADSPLEVALRLARKSGAFRFEGGLDALPDELRTMPGLHSIILWDTRLSAYPDWLSELDELRLLCICDRPERPVPPVIMRMHRLRHLAISGLQADALRDDIAQLRNLETLILTSCGLLRAPDALADNKLLRSLDLSGNQLAGLAGSSLPAGLRYLALWGTGLRTVPETIGAMRDLNVLLLSAHGMQVMHPAVRQLTPMPMPDLPYTIGSPGGPGQYLAEIPDWLAMRCPNITWFDVSGNRLTTVPENLVGLTALRGVVLTANQLTDVPDGLLAMPSLEVAALEHNQLTSAPSVPWNLDRLRYLGLAGNPLPIHPEILDQPERPARIWDFVERVRQGGRPLNEAKLLVVGQGYAGKTSIIRRLLHDDFNPMEPQTVGIEIQQWTVRVDASDIALNVWDFGGQEIMHATHQFFLTKRSVYILVLNARQTADENRVEYWLKIIHGFGGDSPVIVVVNQADGPIELDLNERGLRVKYSRIVAFLRTSCRTGDGLDDLRERITTEIHNLEHVRGILPREYFEVKTRLEAMPENYLSYEQYQELCRRHGVTTTDSQESLIDFLHDLGTVLCFRDDPLLNAPILKPEWVTTGVYQILTAPVARERGGLLSQDEIDQMLDRSAYPVQRRQFIVEMMRKFELCYDSDGKYLIPDLLPLEELDTGPWDNGLAFWIKYDILPSSVISRLFVRMNRYISKRTIWRTGGVLVLDGNRALVKADHVDGLITIAIDGPHDRRRGLLTAIRVTLHAVGDTIPGLVIQERVPVPGHDGIWVPYEHLLNLQAAGRTTVVPQGLVEEFPIGDLLGGVEEAPMPYVAVVGTQPPVQAPPPVQQQPAQREERRFALLFGCFLVATLVVVAGVYVLATQMTQGALTVAIFSATAVAVAVIGVLVLAAAGVVPGAMVANVLAAIFGGKRESKAETS